MNKAYDKVVWVNAPSTSSPLNQTNLNKMSDALDTVDDRVVALDSGKVDKVTGKGLSTNDYTTTEKNELAEIYNDIGFVGQYTGQFTNAPINTQITLKANTTYIIKSYLANRKDPFNVYGYGNTNSYKNFGTQFDSIRFTNDGTNRWLCLYNANSTENIDIKVFEDNSISKNSEEIPKTYIVSKTAQQADYTSLTRCLFDLKDNNLPKTIEVWEGDYDIYAEYKELWDAGLLDIYTGDNPALEYFDYCVWVPENTHIIGKGLVRLKWMPTKENNPEITWKMCYAVSPVNMAFTATIENLEIHCKNGRYCIHNDPLGKPQFIGAIHHYKNIKCYKYECETDTTTTPGESHIYGTYQAVGFGLDRSMHHIYDDCMFVNLWGYRAFYGHTRGAVAGTTLIEATSSEMTFNNCIFETAGNECVKFGNTNNANLHIRVGFNNCYFSHNINLIAESSGSAHRNAYDLTFLNCGTVTVHIADSNNQYPPKAYLTNMTVN